MFDRAVIAAVLARPRLWLEAMRAALDLAPRRWWARPPFLPVPDRDYLAWRLHTAYGTEDAGIAPADAVSYLEWRKRHRSQG